MSDNKWSCKHCGYEVPQPPNKSFNFCPECGKSQSKETEKKDEKTSSSERESTINRDPGTVENVRLEDSSKSFAASSSSNGHDHRGSDEVAGERNTDSALQSLQPKLPTPPNEESNRKAEGSSDHSECDQAPANKQNDKNEAECNSDPSEHFQVVPANKQNDKNEAESSSDCSEHFQAPANKQNDENEAEGSSDRLEPFQVPANDKNEREVNSDHSEYDQVSGDKQNEVKCNSDHNQINDTNLRDEGASERPSGGKQEQHKETLHSERNGNQDGPGGENLQKGTVNL